MKRLFDLLIAIPLGIVLLPITLLIGLAVAVTMGTPIFFTQDRPGLHGVIFRLYKFRTMRTPLPTEDPLKTDGIRLTSLGKLMRSLSLDEVPQLWNVIKGDMSLVGPRPLLPQYLSRYTPEQARRHEVRPGITGWAQINGRNATSWEERFRLDVWYVQHQSFGLDLKILGLTFFKVFQKSGINAGTHATMPEFMGTADSENNKS
jgi:sugar transferase EpsL